MSHLPEEAAEEVLDFARFLHMRKQRSLSVGEQRLKNP